MRPLCTLTLTLALAGLGAGCSTLRGESHKGKIIFSHAQHLAQGDCADCHGEVAKSTGATRGGFIPKGHEGCSKCHEDEVKNKCEMCHRGARTGVALQRTDRHLRFSHAAHTAKVKECATCHPKEKQGGAFVPGHATCNTADCHRGTYKRLACDQCHENLNRYGRQPVSALAHGPGFAKEHGTLAKQSAKACAQCHDQTYCAECHGQGTQAARPSVLYPDEVDRRFIHRGDWMGRHMIESRAAPDTCYKCHGQRFCRACHALSGVADAPARNLKGGITRAHHPGGWMQIGSPDHHGRQARRDIGTCASCHDKGSQSNCVGCHRVGGSGGNPHPPGWSWRNKTAQCRQSGMCASCHPGGQGCK